MAVMEAFQSMAAMGVPSLASWWMNLLVKSSRLPTVETVNLVVAWYSASRTCAGRRTDRGSNASALLPDRLEPGGAQAGVA